ncbi:hypothetical protein Gorai_007901, partial [Gossypium raimondii]|nr:hypothetical protein [Gossypium raimondii]
MSNIEDYGCPHIQAIENNSREITPVIENPRTDVDLVLGNNDFGNWMLVKRWFRHNLCEQCKHGMTGKWDKLLGSRFHALTLNSNFLGKGERYSAMGINGKMLLRKILESPIHMTRGQAIQVGYELGSIQGQAADIVAVISTEFLDHEVGDLDGTMLTGPAVVTFQATSSSNLTGVKGVNKAANLGNTLNRLTIMT